MNLDQEPRQGGPPASPVEAPASPVDEHLAGSAQVQAGPTEPYPPEMVTLRDGTEVIIRAIVPADAPLLQELVRRLSPESIFLRFLTRLKELGRPQAERLANVDYHTQMALVATLGGDIIGVARYAPAMGQGPGNAEAAVVVEDQYQSRGLGTLLLTRLADYAREHDVEAFVASIHPSNERIMRFVRKSGLRNEGRLEGGLWEIRVYLD